MIDAALCDKLYSLIGETLEFYRKFLALETEKYGDVAAGRLKAIDAHMAKEQAFILKAKGLEQERRRLMEQTGQEKATLRELIALLPAEKQPAMRELHSERSRTVNSLKRTNDRCQQLTTIKLRQISKILGGLEGHPELKRIYGSSPEQTPGADGVFSVKI